MTAHILSHDTRAYRQSNGASCHKRPSTPPPGTVPAAVDMLPAVHHSADRYSTMSATRLAAAVRAGEVTAVDLAEAALAAAEQSQTRLNAFISITHERARRDAATLDANRDANPDANR